MMIYEFPREWNEGKLREHPNRFIIIYQCWKNIKKNEDHKIRTKFIKNELRYVSP